MKSPIPWIGGKSQLKSKIIKSFPPTESYNRFIDVFFLQKANTLI
mgnify:CR=1 FL=1